MAAEIEVLEAHLRDNPGDGDSWRVYADWLLDRDDVRGELLSLEFQQQLASQDEAAGLREQKAALERGHAASFREGLWPPAGSRLSWWCGFVVDLELSSAVPLGETLHGLKRLLEHPSGRLLTRLGWVGQGLGDRGVEVLAGWAGLGRFRQLRLTGNRIGDAGAVALARSPGLGALTGLYLSHNGLGAEGVAALAGCPRLRSLQHLTLARNPLGAAGVAALRPLSGLQRLNLDHCGLGDEGLEALAAHRLGGLCSLQVAGNDIGEVGVRALGEGMAALVELDLSDNRLGPEGASVLAKAPLGKLVRLELKRNRIESRGAVALAHSSTLPSLTELGLAANEIGPRGATALLASRTLPSLTQLDLGVNHVGEDAWEPEVGLPRLARLNLSRNGLGDAAAVGLARAPTLGSLRQIDLSRNPIGLLGALALARAPVLSGLVQLDLTGDPLTREGAQALVRAPALAGCDVRT